tara:strand:+ start:189 stop:1364 length:1176 start_codon:yes stop_codon:yes gene_type:complete
MLKKVLLLGDSTIDNCYWVKEGHTVCDYLQLNQPDNEFINYAVDGFTTDSILYGEYKDFEVISKYHPHEYFKTLEAVKDVKEIDYIVLSVGGNDLRAQLERLIFIQEPNREEELEKITDRLVRNYHEIIEELKSSLPDAKLIISFQYTPFIKDDPYLIYFLMDVLNRKEVLPESLYAYMIVKLYSWFGFSEQRSNASLERLHSIMTTVYQRIMQDMPCESYAIADMTNTFDYFDPSLFTSQIEPSENGSKVIASLLSHVINHHDFASNPKLYAQPTILEGKHTFTKDVTTAKIDWQPKNSFITTQNAVSIFKNKYLKKLNEDKGKYFGLNGFFINSNIDISNELKLSEIYKHAMGHLNNGNGHRTLSVLKQLGWVKTENKISENSTLNSIS